jgi:hydrogenase maturation protease
MPRTLVLGLGNILMRDEGLGVRAVERLLERCDFPPEVEVLDGGTLGLNLLPYVEDADRLLVLDAIDVGAEAGTIDRLEGGEVPAFVSVKVSPHQMGLADLLAASRLRGRFPAELVLWGVQPAVIEVGLELSPVVAAQIDTLVERVLAELSQWGIEWTSRLDPEKEGDGRWN